MADIPLAIDPTVKTPGFGLLVDLKAGTPSPGTAALRALIIGSASSAGTITDDTLEEAVGGEVALRGFAGAGTPAHLCGKALWSEHPLALVDYISPPEPDGTAASQTVTFASSPTASRTVTIEIAGRPITIIWAAGETATQGATKAKAAILAQGNDLPVTADNVAGELTITFKLDGTIGNDCTLAVVVTGGAGGTVEAGGAKLASGAGEFNTTAALDAVKNREYHLIVLCTSNADAEAASATSNPGRLKTHINLYDSGLGAKLQQGIVGDTGVPSGVKTGTGQHNYDFLEYIHCKNGRSLPAEWAGAEAGARLREEAKDPAVNRVNNTPYVATLYPPKLLADDALSGVEMEDLLTTGVTPVDYTSNGTPLPKRPVTTYHKDDEGNPDDRVLDVSRVSGAIAVARDMRSFLPAEFPRAKLVESVPEGDDLPDGVVELREIRAAINGRMQFWVGRGVVEGNRWREVVANGEFICRINPSDETQVDLFIPTKIVRPLAKWSTVIAGQ